MTTVVVTDYAFDDLDIERGVLESNGCTLIAQKSGRDPVALAELVRNADGVIAQFAPINAAIINAMQKCRVIVRYGIGVDNVDLEAAAAKGIPVCNVPDYCTDEVADHTLAMVLDLVRRITSNALKVRSGTWGMGVPLDAMHSLKDMTVGVVAFGRIGREVVRRLKAFKCRILVFDPAVEPATIGAAGCVSVCLDELLARSDLITLHCPSTEKTRYMINAEAITRMKDGAMLVNASRGTLVNTDDLVAALRAGKISAAAMDVTDPEPLPADHPLVGMDNVLINAHIASVSPQAVTKLRTDAANIALTAVRGGCPPNVVNGVNA